MVKFQSADNQAVCAAAQANACGMSKSRSCEPHQVRLFHGLVRVDAIQPFCLFFRQLQDVSASSVLTDNVNSLRREGLPEDWTPVDVDKN